MSANKKRTGLIARTSGQPETAGIVFRSSDPELFLTGEEDTPHLPLPGSTGCGKNADRVFQGLKFINGSGHGILLEVKGILRTTFKSMTRRG